MGKDLKGKELGIGLSQRKDGRYRARYKGVDRYAKTLKEARQAYRELVEQTDLKLAVNMQNMKYENYFNEWIAGRLQKHEIGEKTALNYNNMMNVIRKYIGETRLKDITREQIRNIQTQLLKDQKASSVNVTIRMIATVLNSAVDDEILIRNPAKIKACKEKPGTKRAIDTIHRALSDEELTLFMEQLKNQYPQYYNVIDFMLNTGVRTGEMRALRWSDIDYKAELIHISRNVSLDINSKPLETEPKTEAGRRDIPLNDTIKAILKRQKKQNNDFLGNVISISDNVFCKMNGDAIGRETITHIMRVVSKTLRKQGYDFEDYTAHGLRDQFATNAVKKGMDFQTLKSIMGHRSLAMTMDLYAHTLADTKIEEMKKLDNIKTS